MRTSLQRLILLVLASFMIYSPVARSIEPEEYDRLDGHGLTKKKVDVIEWEGNLEIHVYPKGSLRGLGLKIDRTKKDKPVMVIAYRFNSVTYTLYRRAILSIPMADGFKVYEETTADDYDKIMITGNTLTANVRPFVLDPAPTQLYPDHHPMLASGNATATESTAKTAPPTYKTQNKIQYQQTQQGGEGLDSDAPSFKGVEPSQKKKTIDQDGGIRSFSF